MNIIPHRNVQSANHVNKYFNITDGQILQYKIKTVFRSYIVNAYIMHSAPVKDGINRASKNNKIIGIYNGVTVDFGKTQILLMRRSKGF